MTNTEWLESELAEERRIRKMQAEVVKEALDSRDAALAEVERWKADYDRESKACEENAREMQEARAEAEALRAALRAIAGQHGTPDCSGCWWFQHEADIVLARLSPPAPDPFDRLKLGDAGGTVFAKPAPAPAPKVDEERLMENLKDFKTFDNRMHGKPPAPETAPAPKSDEVEIDYSDVERLANPKIRQDVDWTSGREARRSYESFYGKPAPETGKCTCPPNSLDVLCPLPIKDHGAPAPCKHSWVEEENEADQRQTACQKCGAVCSTGSKDPLHQCGCDPPAPAAENAPTVVWGPECNCWPPTPPHRHGMSNGTMIVEFGPRRGRER